MNLPDGYRDLQKLAGDVPSASGKGSKEDIIQSLKDAPEEEVQQALESTEEAPGEEKNISNEDEIDEEPSNNGEKREEEPELTYTGSRDQDGDLFGRDNPEEEVLEKAENKENNEEEVIDTTDQDEKSSDVEKPEVEEVELDTEIFQYPHMLVNRAIAKLLEKRFGVEVPNLEDEDLQELERNTEIVVDEKLSFEQKQKLQTRSGMFGMVVPHAKQLIKGVVGTEDKGENNKDSDEEVAETVKNPIKADDQEDEKLDFNGDAF